MPGISDVFARLLLRSVILLVVVVGMTGCSSLTRLYFHPKTLWLQTPDRFGVAYDDVWLTAADGTNLHAWLLSPPEGTPKSDAVVLYLHGNAENISTHSRSIFWLVEAGYSVLALDYRGFGASQGSARMPEVLFDVEAGAAWLANNFPDERLIVLGQSMGAALAITFTADKGEQYGVDLVLAEAPFAGFGSVARAMLQKSVVGFLISPLTYLIPTRWDPREKIGSVQVPVMIMHSRMDDIVPVGESEALMAELPPEKRCFAYTQGPHIGSFRYGVYRELTLEYLVSGVCPKTRTNT